MSDFPLLFLPTAIPPTSLDLRLAAAPDRTPASDRPSWRPWWAATWDKGADSEIKKLYFQVKLCLLMLIKYLILPKIDVIAIYMLKYIFLNQIYFLHTRNL